MEVRDETVMSLEVREKYSFNDIYVFGKTMDGYISLSDYELSYNCCTKFNNESRFLLGLPAIEGYYISEATIDDIMALAGMSPTTNFIRQCRHGVDLETSDALIAILCAKKILNTKHGKIELCDDEQLIYSLSRRKTDGNSRAYGVVCKKQFVKGAINGKNEG